MDQNEINTDLAPAISEVVAEAGEVINKIMSKGSDKSVFGQWFHTDSRRYNADRLISHVTQAMMQIDGNRPDPDTAGETSLDHLERALVRAMFLLYKTRRGKTL
jgi:hypothetical protein